MILEILILHEFLSRTWEVYGSLIESIFWYFNSFNYSSDKIIAKFALPFLCFSSTTSFLATIISAIELLSFLTLDSIWFYSLDEIFDNFRDLSGRVKILFDSIFKLLDATIFDFSISLKAYIWFFESECWLLWNDSF